MTLAPPPTRNRWLVFAFFFAVTLVLLMVTNPWYGYAIDEASYLWVAREERTWFTELGERPWSDSFSREGLARRWHFLEVPQGQSATHSNFNLPLAMHLLNVGWLLSAGQAPELWSARLSSMILFSLLVATVHRTISDRFGPRAGWGAALFLIASPRVFGHAHLAATETPLSCFWWFTTLALVGPGRSVSPGRWWIVPALLSATMAVKLTGWFLAPVVLVGLAMLRPAGWVPSMVGCILFPVPAILLLTPTLWHDPWNGLRDYLSAAANNPWTIPSYFMGEVTSERLPGWTGGAIFAVTSPVATLLFGLSGSISSITNRSLAVVTLSTWSLLAARLAGLLPTHDVERQFEPALYGIALLAGIAAARLTERSTLRPLWSALLLGLCLAEPITESVLHRAHGLCFYNQSVGGVRGAHEIGLETTYWFETITDSDWHALLDDLPPNTTVFLRPDHPGLEDLRRWGIWRKDLRSVGPEAAVYILYAKRSAYFLRDNQTGQWVPTDLGFRAEQGRADREHRFQAVRLWSRQPGR